MNPINKFIYRFIKPYRKRRLKIDTLPSTWIDKDEILLHASFQILIDFVDKEKAYKVVDWHWDEVHDKAWSEIQDLYTWWTDIRPKRKDPLDNVESPDMDKVIVEVPGKDFYRFDSSGLSDKFKEAADEHRRLEKEWFEEDQRNLHRLIEIRKFLWT